jgi:dienelactone hydrolase
MKIFFILVLIPFFVSACSSYKAFDEVDNYLVSTSEVTYEIDGTRQIFIPVSSPKDTAVIMYPGGSVEPEAYAPLCHRIAQNGYRAILVTMPFDLAALGVGEAKKVVESYADQGITKWVIMGHSLGGSMACSFIKDNPQVMSGLVLMGAYPPDDADMSNLPIKALSIYAEFNDDSNYDEQMARKYLMPADTSYYEILGGNHAQFGYYGPQDGDGIATITLYEQQDQTLNRIVQFLSEL